MKPYGNDRLYGRCVDDTDYEVGGSDKLDGGRILGACGFARDGLHCGGGRDTIYVHRDWFFGWKRQASVVSGDVIRQPQWSGLCPTLQSGRICGRLKKKRLCESRVKKSC